MVYLKISKDNNCFHIGIDGINENSILNLTSQNMILGYQTESSTKDELYNYFQSLTEEEQDENELMYENWDILINWDIIFSD